MSKKGDHYIVRLLMQDTYTQQQRTADDSGTSEKIAKKGTNYINHGRKNAYTSSLIKLVRLRAILDDKSDIKHSVTLKVKGENGNLIPIKWEDFCFEKDDLLRLYELIKEQRLRHSICVMGDASLNKTDKQWIAIEYKASSNKRYVLEVDSSNIKIDELTLKKKKVCIYLNTMRYSVPKKWKDFLVYYNIYGTIFSNKQIVTFVE